MSPILTTEPPNAQKCCAEKGERECFGFIRRTEVGVVQNGLSLHVCMFVLLGSARKNDMPCSGQPKRMMGNHIFAHFFGVERHICITFLATFLWYREAIFASHFFATFLWYREAQIGITFLCHISLVWRDHICITFLWYIERQRNVMQI